MPTANPRWKLALDVERCIGCHACSVACKVENNVPLARFRTKVYYWEHGTYPKVTRNFLPTLCMQCEDAPCIGVCPVGATFHTPDGIVLIDEDRCIGCGYCIVACPYGARYIVPAGGDMPRGVPGVADKCTLCYHRISTGGRPACVEACPVGARAFGDLNDPTSSVSVTLRKKPTMVLKGALGTKPRVYYVGLEGEAMA